MISTSIIFEPVWAKIEPYLHVVEYDRDGGHEDPRIRIEFLDVPEKLSRELVMATMRCVHCQRPIHPLRRRDGDDWDRLFYAPTCPITVRMSCSRGRAAELEYERFKGLKHHTRPSAQLALF
jgi:hypothetical protein